MTVIKFETASSLAYNSNYEIRIYKDAKDRADMSINTNVCEGTTYCSYSISTQISEHRPEKEKPSIDNYKQNTGFFNNYYWSDSRPNYNYNLSYWSGVLYR